MGHDRGRPTLAFCALALWAALAAAPAAQERPSVAIPPDMPAFAHAPLTPNALRGHVERLASDAFEGRAPASRGEALTLDYISRAFAAAGLAPGGDAVSAGGRDWRQRVPLVSSTVRNYPTLVVHGGDGARAYVAGEQVVMWTKRLEPRVALERAEIVFVGYGVVSPELGWNDYVGVDMTGKIALVLINDPDCETGDDRGFRGRDMSYFGRLSTKIEEAGRHGAAGVVVVHEDGPAGFPWAVVRSSWTGPQFDLVRDEAGSARPAVEGWIAREAAADLFARAGLSFAAEKARAQRPDFSPRPLGLSADAAIDSQIEQIASHNVVGLLGGRSRHQEAVIFTAHWDHLGRCERVGRDDLCNGALDNASGVAGLIELARRFAYGGRTERSIVFLATTAEESGLLGSAYYVRHPNFPPARTAGVINMDMLNNAGPTRDIAVVGHGQNELALILREAAERHGRRIEPDPHPEHGAFFRSDHLSFAQVGVPVLFTSAGVDLYSGGPTRGRALAEAYLAERYHKPGDELTSAWDLTGAFQDLLLLHEVGERLANSNQWPNWREDSEFRRTRDVTRRAR